ncbi:MAG: rRNA maturation RNase YbeY [Paracoccaceae bacterium]
MSVDVILEDERWSTLDLAECSQRAFDAVMYHFDLTDVGFECCVMGCDDAKIAELNGDFRDKPQATNVLSWPSVEHVAREEGARPVLPDITFDPELGDIAISYDTCLREAEAGQIAPQHHVTHLIVHAVLHLLGYDHIRDQDATLMEGIEIEILGNMGIANPYDQ